MKSLGRGVIQGNGGRLNPLNYKVEGLGSFPGNLKYSGPRSGRRWYFVDEGTEELIALESREAIRAVRVAPKGEANYIRFNKTHKGSMPRPKGTGPGGGKLQSHHGLQKEWAMSNLKDYGYDPSLAPSITLETGRGFPHTAISNAQNLRRNARVAAGKGKWSSSVQDELQYIVDDFTEAGFSSNTIEQVMEQQYNMMNKIGVPFERINF